MTSTYPKNHDKEYFYLICTILVALNCTVKSGKNTSSASAIAVDEDIKEVISDLYSSITMKEISRPIGS